MLTMAIQALESQHEKTLDLGSARASGNGRPERRARDRRPAPARIQRERNEAEHRLVPLIPLLSAVALLVLVGISGCSFDASGLKPACTSSACGGEITLYGLTNPSPGLTPGIHGSQPVAWDWESFELTDPKKVVTFYLGGGHGTKDVPSVLKGSYLLHLQNLLRTNNLTSGLIDIQIGAAEVDRFWVAFDVRASKAPDWLTKDFQPTIPQTLITSTKADATNSGGYVQYQLWEPKDPQRFAQAIRLGGNNAPGIVWKSGSVGEQYLLLVRMKPQIDYTKSQVLDHVTVEVCLRDNATPEEVNKETSATGKQKLEEWLAKPENTKYLQAYQEKRLTISVTGAACGYIRQHFSSLTVDKAGASADGLSVFAVGSWVRESEAAIDPTQSLATVSADGTPTTAPLAGRVSFLVNEASNVEIGELSLFGEQVGLSDGTTITHLSFGQRGMIPAQCNDNLPPGPFRLCGQYLIPAGAMKASGSGRVDGNVIVADLENSQDLDVSVDFNNRTFHMSGGPLSGTVDLGERRIELAISLDIEGDFVNFAPKASTIETKPYWECVDSNQAMVTLLASASTDEDGKGDIQQYTWIEDAGLLSEKVLGTGPSLTVPMSFGIHPVTLTVRDSFDIPDSDTIAVEVGDSRIDHALAPPDVYAIEQDETGAFLDIGQAQASDWCSGQVLVENNAPADGHFPPGMTEVVWTFDDQRGNLQTQIQRVYVFQLFMITVPVWEVGADEAPAREPGAIDDLSESGRRAGPAPDPGSR